MMTNVVGVAKRNKFLVAAAVAYLVTLAFSPAVFLTAIRTTGGYLKEMLQIMPAVFVISALITVWVPQEVIMRHFGQQSGFRGKLASVFIGSVSAGPIYAAFPIAESLLKKGASISNVVVIISAWAVIKVPMLIVEAKFLGAKFTALRYLWTVPSIIAIGVLSERFLAKRPVPVEEGAKAGASLEERVLQALPGFSCKACGYGSCSECAVAIAQGDADPSVCRPGGAEVEGKVRPLLAEARLVCEGVEVGGERLG